MLTKRSANPNFIEEDEEFELEYLSQEDGSGADVKYKKFIHLAFHPYAV